MIRKWGTENDKKCTWGVGIVAKLYQHRTYGAYYTKRSHGAGIVTWQIHPDGVAFLKQRGVTIGADIPSYALHVLADRNWLFTREEAAQCGEIDWAPAWADLGQSPAGHYPLWLARQKRDCAALMVASRRLAEGEQRAHHKEDEAAPPGVTVPTTPAPAIVLPGSSASMAITAPREAASRRGASAAASRWFVFVLTALALIAIVAVAG